MLCEMYEYNKKNSNAHTHTTHKNKITLHLFAERTFRMKDKKQNRKSQMKGNCRNEWDKEYE